MGPPLPSKPAPVESPTEDVQILTGIPRAPAGPAGPMGPCAPCEGESGNASEQSQDREGPLCICPGLGTEVAAPTAQRPPGPRGASRAWGSDSG